MRFPFSKEVMMVFYCKECLKRLHESLMAEIYVDAFGEEKVTCRKCYKKEEQLSKGKYDE